MGYLWSRMVCFAGESAGEIAGSSLFAEIAGSFSTVSQEKRHENLPSWYGSSSIRNTVFPWPDRFNCFWFVFWLGCLGAVNMVLTLGCLRRRLFGGCGVKDIDYWSRHWKYVPPFHELRNSWLWINSCYISVVHFWHFVFTWRKLIQACLIRIILMGHCIPFIPI